jgi:hypothetical protein
MMSFKNRYLMPDSPSATTPANLVVPPDPALVVAGLEATAALALVAGVHFMATSFNGSCGLERIPDQPGL